MLANKEPPITNLQPVVGQSFWSMWCDTIVWRTCAFSDDVIELSALFADARKDPGAAIWEVHGPQHGLISLYAGFYLCYPGLPVKEPQVHL